MKHTLVIVAAQGGGEERGGRLVTPRMLATNRHNGNGTKYIQVVSRSKHCPKGAFTIHMLGLQTLSHLVMRSHPTQKKNQNGFCAVNVALLETLHSSAP